MTSVSLPYGKSQLNLSIPKSFPVDIIMPPVNLPSENGTTIVQNAIDQPVGSFSWNSLPNSGQVAIAINDKTRPVPNAVMVPALLKQLAITGFTPEQITFFIATGTHTPMRSDEFHLLLPPDLVSRYRIVSHDCDDTNNLYYLGETTRHTPVWVNSEFFHSDLKILVGNIEPHHFMGYSGGAKTASIGLTGRQTININHAMLVEPTSTFGVFSGNSTREDVEEMGDLIHIHAALNVVMNPAKQIMHAVFGKVREVMASGIPLSRQICQTRIEKAGYDLVIASPGGYPKDINLYQSQKALSHAARITRNGGCVILVAQCVEGVGSHSYEAFMEGLYSVEDVYAKLNLEGFKVGPHKAFQFAREQSRIRIIVVSSLEAKRIGRLLLEPASSLDVAFEMASSTLPENPRIAIMPKATNTIPLV